MNQDFDGAMAEWTASQRPTPARLREIMLASRKETELDAAWWKAQFVVMRTALNVTRDIARAHHFG